LLVELSYAESLRRDLVLPVCQDQMGQRGGAPLKARFLDVSRHPADFEGGPIFLEPLLQSTGIGLDGLHG